MAGGLVALCTLPLALAAVTGAASASAATGAQTPPNAQLITVTGSSLSNITAAPTSFTAAMTPAFSPTTNNYVLNCPAATSSVTFTMTAATGTITVNGNTGASEPATVSLTTNQAAVVQAPSPTNPAVVSQYWIRCLPTDFPPLQVVTDTGKAPEGYYLTENALVAAGSGRYVMILDRHGTPVWWQSVGPTNPAYFQQWSPNTLAWDSNNNGGAPQFVNADGYTTYNLKTGASATLVPNNQPADPHDIIHLSDGNIIFLTDPEVTGVDLSSIGKGTNQNVADCALQEVTPTGQVVWSWDALQHIGIDESVAPLTDTVNGQQVVDLFHCNSVSLDQSDPNQETANVVLSARELSGIYLINRATGNIIWKVGQVKPSAGDPDASAQFLTIQNDGEGGFYAEHNAQLSATGELTLFDDHSGPPFYNDPGETPGVARGVEYKINTKAGTATLDWAYVTTDGENSFATGSFNRYPVAKGGTDNVICWGANNALTSGGVTTAKLFTEVNGSRTVELAVDWVEPATGATNLSYRVIKLTPSQISIGLLHKNMGGLP
jgi:Arylsulfotransferase (ASST)